MTQELADKIRALWQQADSVRYELKKLFESMDEDTDGYDSYYAHQHLLDQLDQAAGRLDDADTEAEKIMREHPRG
jgi:uncharacterized coiled-coil DUF342 family protein